MFLRDVHSNTLLAISQQKSEDMQQPLVIAILAEDYLSYIDVLYQHWQRQQRPWHIMVVDKNYRNMAAYFQQVQHHLSDKLRDFWLRESPLPMSVLHRLDIVSYQFCIHLLCNDSAHAWKVWSADIDVFIGAFDKNGLIVDRNDWQDALRLSTPKPILLLEHGLFPQLQPLLGAQQFSYKQIKTSTDDYIQLFSHKPSKCVASERGRKICIIGGGVAGAGVAFALAQRQWKVKVFDSIFTEDIRETLAYQLASGAVTPLITADDCHKARLSRAGVLRAHARWKELIEDAGIRYCGTLELNRDKGHAKDLFEAVAALDFPQEWVKLLSAEQASERAGVPIEQAAAFFPKAMQVAPVRLAHALLQHENIRCIPSKVSRIQTINDSEKNTHYVLFDEQGQELAQSAFVVVANAMESLPLLRTSGFAEKTLKSGRKINALSRFDSLHALAGEVMWIPQKWLGGGPSCVIGGQGYYLPAQEGFCVMGSTYVHNDLHPEVTRVGQEAIWNKMPLNLPVSLSTLQSSGELKGRACVRAVIQGRLPIIGELSHAPGLWVATAYASHGMTWSSLAGDIVGASLEGEPLPIERDLILAISPK